MTDDLVKRLREGDEFERFMLAEGAADRIEQLTATNEELSNCVAVLEADLREMALDYLAAQGQASENFQMYVDANEARIDAEAKLSKAVGQMQRVKDYRYDPNIGIELNRLEEALAELKERTK